MTPAGRRALRTAQVAVSLCLLAYVIATVPMRDVLASLASAHASWLVGAFALVGLMHLVASLQTRAILASQGMVFSLRQVAGINLITSFYGLFLPSYLAGGVIRWHHFSRPEGKRAQALAALIFSREVELVTTLGFGIVFWNLAKSAGSTLSVIATLVIALAAAVLIVLLSVSPLPHRMLRAALTRVPLAGRHAPGILKVSACLVDFGRHGRGYLLRFLLLCIARNVVGVVAFVFFARALDIALPAVDLGWIRATLDLVLILPISVAGLGVRDASLVAMLSHVGVASSAALAFSCLQLARTLLVAMLGGLVEGWRVYYGVAPGLVSSKGGSDWLR